MHITTLTCYIHSLCKRKLFISPIQKDGKRAKHTELTFFCDIEKLIKVDILNLHMQLQSWPSQIATSIIVSNYQFDKYIQPFTVVKLLPDRLIWSAVVFSLSIVCSFTVAGCRLSC